jgi:hypothetical protein
MKTIHTIKEEAQYLEDETYLDYIMDEYQIDKSLKKSEYKDELLSILDKQHNKNIPVFNNDICEGCKYDIKTIEPMDGYITCISCGLVHEVIYDKEYVPTYKEFQDIEFVPYFMYKKINHFQDWINFIQGKENTTIPTDIILKIKKEIKRLKLNDIDYYVLRSVLKKLKLNKYYENSSLILNILNIGNHKSVSLTREQENILINKFKIIQRPYDKHIPEGRSNFLSYSFILRKLCIL